MLRRLAIAIFAVALLFSSRVHGYAGDANTPFTERFTAESLFSNWNIEKSQTAAECKVVSPGRSGGTCLEVNMPDSAGSIWITRKIPVEQGTNYLLTADIRALFVGPLAEFFVSVHQLDADGKLVGSSDAYPFNDGLSCSSSFGGEYKTPQTLNKWTTTCHLFKIRPGVSSIRLGFMIRSGRQIIRLDNVCLKNLVGDVKAEDLPLYHRDINSVAAFLNVDVLLPGFTYELTADTDSTDLRGFGIQFSTVDLHGKVSTPESLLPAKEDGKTLVYRFSVPENAFSTHLDLYNSDLTILGWNQVAKYRKWKSISIRNIAQCPPLDTLYENYRHKVEGEPELSKPREVKEVTDYDRLELNAYLATRETCGAEVRKINGGMAIALGDKIFHRSSMQISAVEHCLIHTVI